MIYGWCTAGAEKIRGSLKKGVSAITADKHGLFQSTILCSCTDLCEDYYISVNPETPPETINFIATGPGMLSALTFSLGTTK